MADNYQNSVKSVSFLLANKHGFKQAPYQAIDETTYNRATAKLKPISSIYKTSGDMLDLVDCAGGACPIR